MTSPSERSTPEIPADTPEPPKAPGGDSPPIIPTPLDQFKDTIIDDIGTFTRITIPGVEFPGLGPPGGTKLD
jgi:hypothetical protein